MSLDKGDIDIDGDIFARIMQKFGDTTLKDLLDEDEQKELAENTWMIDGEAAGGLALGADIPVIKRRKHDLEDLAAARLKEKIRKEFPDVADEDMNRGIQLFFMYKFH